MIFRYPLALRTMSHVRRWPTACVVHEQNVAEHSFYVAYYTHQIMEAILWPDMGKLNQYAMNEMRYYVILMALYHDMDETITGDISGPAKHAIIDPDRAQAYLFDRMDAAFGTNRLFRFTNYEQWCVDARLIVKAANCVDEIMYCATEIARGNQWMRSNCDQAYRRLKLAWDNLPTSEEIRNATLREVQSAVQDHMHPRPVIVGEDLK